MQKNAASLFGDLSNIDQRSAQMLVDALLKNNKQGFDYLEFKQALVAQAQMNLDETISFKTVYATASTMGLSVSKLLETANFYKQVLQGEKSKFDEAVKTQVMQKIAARQDRTKKLHQAISQKKEQIAKLQQQIEQHEEEVNNAQQIIEAEKSKILSKKDSFESTFNKIIEQVDGDIQKINTYLSNS